MPGWPTDKAVKDAAQAIGALEYGNADECAIAALYAAGLPELVSHAEARAILGTRNPRLPAGMPAPLYENVGDRKLWLRDDVEAFATEFQARPHVRSRRAS
jgi:hypothetical protein